jgi:hypothetical protein
MKHQSNHNNRASLTATQFVKSYRDKNKFTYFRPMSSFSVSIQNSTSLQARNTTYWFFS